jgi:hypothetical protein
MPTDAVCGATVTATLLVIATLADATAVPPVACTVTGFGLGIASGAV